MNASTSELLLQPTACPLSDLPAARADYGVSGDVTLRFPPCNRLTAAITREIPSQARHFGDDGSWLVTHGWDDVGCHLLRQVFPDAPVYLVGESPEARQRLSEAQVALLHGRTRW